MKLRSVCVGIASALLSSAALGQTAPKTGVIYGVQPYAPAERGAVAQPFSPKDFRVQPRQEAADGRPNLPAPRVDADRGIAAVFGQSATDYRVPSPRGDDGPAFTATTSRNAGQPLPGEPKADRPAQQDSKDAQQVRPMPQPATRAQGSVDPRIVNGRKEEYIDYKPGDGRTFDFRPVDFKPVDTRAVEYRSQDNKTPDQKVFDPRLKERGVEIPPSLDCRAILYRAVECNFTDFRELEPRLQEIFGKQAEVTFGIVPNDFSKELMDKWQPLLVHMSAQIGIKVSLKIANDYASLAESQRAGLVHMAIYSPLAFARARASGVKIEPIAVETNAEGRKGFHSVIYSLASAPRSDDVRGKSMGLVDPNSMSGNFVPRLMTASQKADFDATFKTVYTGSHENALAALAQGLVDFAVGEWRSEDDSTLTRVLNRGIKSANGTPLKRDDFRMVAKSELIANAPIVFLADLPEDIKAIIRKTVVEAPLRDKTAFERVYANKTGWDAIDGKAYDTASDLLKIVDEARMKQQASLSSQQGREARN